MKLVVAVDTVDVIDEEASWEGLVMAVVLISCKAGVDVCSSEASALSSVRQYIKSKDSKVGTSVRREARARGRRAQRRVRAWSVGRKERRVKSSVQDKSSQERSSFSRRRTSVTPRCISTSYCALPCSCSPRKAENFLRSNSERAEHDISVIRAVVVSLHERQTRRSVGM